MSDILVYQACTKPTPSELKRCLKNTKQFAVEHGYRYQRSKLVLGPFRFISASSDLERVKMLAQRPYTLWVDWDLMLLDDFKLPDNLDQPMRARDFLIWNGADTKPFAEALRIFEAYHQKFPSGYNEHYRMWKCLKQAGFREIPEFDRVTYKHLNWSKKDGKTVSHQAEQHEGETQPTGHSKSG